MKWTLDGELCVRALPEAGDTEAILPPQTVRIAPGALSGCARIERIVLPDGVRVLPVGFAQGCTALREVRWGAGLTQIRAGAFSGCASLREIQLPPGVTEIGEGAFSGIAPQADIVVLGPYTLRLRQARPFPPFERLRALCAPQAHFAAASGAERLALACGYCLHPEHEARYAAEEARAIRAYLNEELPERFGVLCERGAGYDVLLACAERGLIRDPGTLRRLATYARTQPTSREQKLRLARMEAGAGLDAGDGADECDKRLLRRIRERMPDAQMRAMLARERIGALPVVRYRDGSKPAPREALAYLLCAYMGEWPELNARVPALRRLPEADEIAALLDGDDLRAACTALRCPQERGADGRISVRAVRRLIPCLRYGGAEEAVHAIACAGRWREYGVYGADGLIAAEAAEHAVLLGDAREALVYAARCGRLLEYAAQRGLAAAPDAALMARFSLTEEEVHRFTLDGEAWDAQAQPDGSLRLCRVRDGVPCEQLPEGETDAARAQAVSFRMLQAHTEEIAAQTRRLIARELTDGRARGMEQWRQTYGERRAARAVAQGVLWQQACGEACVRFLMRGDGTVGADGGACPLMPDAQVCVAHPAQIPEAELALWRAHPALGGQLELPLLPVRPEQPETWTDRYDGLIVPMGRLSALGGEGIALRRMSAGQVQLLFFGSYAAGLKALVPDAQELGPDTPMRMGSLGGAHLQPRALLRLTALLDRALLPELIVAGRAEAGPHMALLDPAQMEPLLARCIEAGRTDSVAALLAWRTQHAPQREDPLAIDW